VAEGEEPVKSRQKSCTDRDIGRSHTTVTEEPVPSELPDSYVIMELDKTKVKVGT